MRIVFWVSSMTAEEQSRQLKPRIALSQLEYKRGKAGLVCTVSVGFVGVRVGDGEFMESVL